MKKWSAKVTKESNALDLEEGVFTFKEAAIQLFIKHTVSSLAPNKCRWVLIKLRQIRYLL